MDPAGCSKPTTTNRWHETRRWYVPGQTPTTCVATPWWVLGNTADGGDDAAVGLLRRYLRHRDDNLVAYAPGRP